MNQQSIFDVSIATIIIAGTILFLLFSGFTIAFGLLYQKKRTKYLLEMASLKHLYEQEILKTKLETQEETFATLGKELHDNVGQLLNSAKLLIGVTQRKLVDPPDTLAIADETLGTAISELRSLSKSLNKEWLQQFNLIENLQTEIKRINAADNLQIHFTHPVQLPLKSDEQIILFRIVQEALQNAIKHAQANSIGIEMEEKESLLTISIHDDGKGIEEKETSQLGMGLLNMQQRAKLLGGFIQWQSSSKGTHVTIQLPVKPVSE